MEVEIRRTGEVEASHHPVPVDAPGATRARPQREGQWSESALRVLRERYLLKRDGRVVETPDEMCWRVCDAVAAAESRWHSHDTVDAIAEQYYDMLIDRKFMPNSPTLMNAGTGNGLQYSACYVLPVGDSIPEIFDTLKNAAIIHQSGGGTGFAFSRVRRKDSIVSRSGGRASGPVSFLRVYNAATEAVKQGGTRRGANMGILRVDHPDVLEFIECKNDGGITNFNISVAITDAFMTALQNDDFYDLVDPHSHEVANRLQAKEVWARIIDSAWRTGDPGLVFIDRINASPANPTPELGLIEATNPCGEQPLLPNEACNLGSLNVAKFVVERGGTKEIDWAELERVAKLCARFLDDVIEVNPYPLPEIDAMVKANRRIGLGIMGWADLLFELEIPYDSEQAVQLADRLWSFVERASHQQSQELARVRGPFPNWKHSIYRDGPPLRNSTVTTIAPTGTISIIADASSGIEPVFALAFQHKVDQRTLTFVNPIFVQAAKDAGIHSEDLMDRVSARGTVHGVDAVPANMQRVFATAHEVAPEWHVRTQAAFQRHTDNGVSKTINLPNEATRSDVENAYNLAWQLGCLGITVFRDGSKGLQVLNAGVEGKKTDEVVPLDASERAAEVALPGFLALKPRPRKVLGETYRIETPLGTAFVTVNMDSDGEPLEAFVNIGRAGSDVSAVAEALGRLISLVLRTPSPLTQREKIAQIVDQLGGIGGSRSLGFGPQRILSLPDAVAKVLDDYTAELAERVGELERGEQRTKLSVAADICPSCGWAAFVHEEGCKKCHFCGHSEC
ncbi:MAG: vitamin B12-dependent ribonucleotide reductase [Chloroflexota bacterium]